MWTAPTWTGHPAGQGTTDQGWVCEGDTVQPHSKLVTDLERDPSPCSQSPCLGLEYIAHPLALGQREVCWSGPVPL